MVVNLDLIPSTCPAKQQLKDVYIGIEMANLTTPSTISTAILSGSELPPILTHRQTDRHTDRQTDRHTDRQTDRQTHRQTHTHRD